MNPVLFYLKMLVYVVLALLLRVVSLIPLYALVRWSDRPLRYLACLTPALLLFVVLPLRFSFADALVQPSRERNFCLGKAFSFSQYGQKLIRSWEHMLHLLFWGFPFLAVTGTLVLGYFDGKLLSLKTANTVSTIGNRWNELYYGVLNFFRRLLGMTEIVIPTNGFMDGFYVILGIIGICLLFWLWGVVRNSAFRYIWVKAERENRSMRSALRNQLVGRRWRQIGVAMLNLLLYVPFFLCAYLLCRESFTQLCAQLFSVETIQFMFLSHKLPSIDLSEILRGLAISFALCYLTILPVRRYLTANFAVSNRRHTIE